MSTMKGSYVWEIIFNFWIQLVFVSWINCKEGTVNHLSPEDVSLLKDEQDPKCFTRMEEDFTCFFETKDNGTYDFFYNFIKLPREKRCETSLQKTEDGTFLHICPFPSVDVGSYVDIHLNVVERSTNSSLYRRIVNVEDQFLLDPPFNVSLHENGQPGQLQVSWRTNVSKYWKNKVRYRVRYSSKGLGRRTTEGAEMWDDALLTLVPGEEVHVQVAVKCAHRDNAGHWSRWSESVRAAVPQSADDISLMCFTSDLQSVTCQWNGSKYSNETKLFYKMHLSGALGWTEWTECLHDRKLIPLCSFHGDESRKVTVKLTCSSGPHSRTFYTPEFTINSSIRTSPPGHLRGTPAKDKLCLKWDTPLHALSAHLQYEVAYRMRERQSWLMISLKGSVTNTCLDAPAGRHYSVKVRTKPDGSIYSGHWSDWSHVLTGDTPTDIDTLLMTCVPATILIAAVILIALFSSHFRKLKRHVWPPVPNLDKVLQDFLTELNGQRWDPPVPAKQCCEEATPSVVEVMSKVEVSTPEEPLEESSQLLTPQEGSRRGESIGGGPETELKVFPDYVTLSRDGGSAGSKGNKYVPEQVGERRQLEDELHYSCTEESTCVQTCFVTDLLNQSYLPLAEDAPRGPAARGPGNLYTNLP